jgi:hypothetical protein
MLRIISILLFVLATMGSLAALAAVAPVTAAVPVARPASPPLTVSSAPDVDCSFTPLTFSIAGNGPLGVSRPMTITAGDTFEQFIAPPITSTASSFAYAIGNESYTGSLSGGITGTFALNNLNGVLVTNPEGLTTPRGFQLNDIVLQGATGTITAVVAINLLGLSPIPPFLPRGFNGYLHSIATSGSYAGYRFNGTIAGTMFPTAGMAGITATVIGRLYTGGDTLNEFVTGLRTVPPNRATDFQPTDVIAQLHLPDFAVGAAAPGHVTPRSAFVGTTIGTINGGFVMDHDALIVDGGPNANKGWFAGEFTFSNTDADILTGPWLADLSGNSMNGYVWQVIGTGVYTDSLMFATVNATLTLGGTSLAGTMSGVYCQGSQLPTPTATLTPTPGATNTASATPAPSMTATATAVSTNTPAPTDTPVPATLTTTPTTETSPTIAATATSTNTPCSVSFSDVNPPDYFYVPVMYLACHSVISGYADGTFRPYNDTTRGQLSKIVVLAEGWQLDCPLPGHFTDVPPTDPFFCYIETAYSHQIISGYADGTFRPGNNVTRGQLCKIVVLAEGWTDNCPPSGHFSDVPPDHPFFCYIETAFAHGIISGYADGTFRPGNSATRGQISKIVYEAITAP